MRNLIHFEYTHPESYIIVIDTKFVAIDVSIAIIQVELKAKTSFYNILIAFSPGV
jgi:hypothetical protein